MNYAVLFALVFAVPALADVCALTDVQGAYGFQMSGTSMISGRPAPVAAIGRVVFDAERHASGYSSVNFNGLFLGNPVKGSYEFKTDCSIVYKLQDTSGGWQSFAGKARPGGAQIEFHQTDAGSGARGTMIRLSPVCSATAFAGTYHMTMTAASTPLSRESLSSAQAATARVQADGAGGLTLVWSDEQTSGTYQVNGECFVELEFAPPQGIPMKLRGVLVDAGNLVIAAHTDPQAVGTARLRR